MMTPALDYQAPHDGIPTSDSLVSSSKSSIRTNSSLKSTDASSVSSNSNVATNDHARSTSPQKSQISNSTYVPQDRRVPSELMEMSNQYTMNYDHGYGYPAAIPEDQYQQQQAGRQHPLAMSHRRNKSLELLRALPNRNVAYDEYQYANGRPVYAQDQFDFQPQVYVDERVGRSPQSQFQSEYYRPQSYSPVANHGSQSPPVQNFHRARGSIYSNHSHASSTSSLSRIQNFYPTNVLPRNRKSSIIDVNSSHSRNSSYGSNRYSSVPEQYLEERSRQSSMHSTMRRNFTTPEHSQYQESVIHPIEGSDRQISNYQKFLELDGYHSRKPSTYERDAADDTLGFDTYADDMDNLTLEEVSPKTIDGSFLLKEPIIENDEENDIGGVSEFEDLASPVLQVDSSSQEESELERKGSTKSVSSSTSQDSMESGDSIVRGSSGKFKVISADERIERIHKKKEEEEKETAEQAQKEAAKRTEADSGHKKQSSLDSLEDSPDAYNVPSVDKLRAAEQNYYSSYQFNEHSTGSQKPRQPSQAYAELASQAREFDPAMVRDLESLSHYSGNSGFSSEYSGSNSSHEHTLGGIRRPPSMMPYEMGSPSMEPVAYVNEFGMHLGPSPDMYHQPYLSPNLRSRSHSPSRVAYMNQHSPQYSPNSHASPRVTTYDDEKTARQIDDFVTLRKLILTGHKSLDFRLKWVIALIEASRSKLYQYVTVKGQYLRNVNFSVVEQNRYQFNKSAVSHLLKIVNDPNTLKYKKEASDSFFIYASMLSGEIAGFVTRDLEEAFNFYYNAAKYGNATATFRVGEYLEKGVGADPDTRKALQFYNRAAKLGDISAKYRFAMIYLNGELGLPRSAKCFDYLMEVSSNPASKGEEVGKASFELGVIYEGTYPVSEEDEDFFNDLNEIAPVDASKALFFYSKAAKQDNMYAKAKLGKVYEFGELNRQKDAKKSIHWYCETIALPESMLGLSRWYLSGEAGIIKRDHEQALNWAKKASVSGLVEADYTLARYMEAGIGAPKNMEDANRWYLRAAHRGHELAQQRIQYYAKPQPQPRPQSQLHSRPNSQVESHSPNPTTLQPPPIVSDEEVDL